MDQPPSKRLKLDAAGAAVGSATTPATAAAAAAMGDGIALMLLDIQETAGGAMQLWGKTPKGQTVLVHVPDFEPYFYVPAPLRAPTAAGPQRGEWSEEEEDPTAAGSDQELQQQDLEQLKHLVNCRLPSDSRVTRCDLVTAIPVMYYRPAQPQGGPHVRFMLKTGSSVKRVATLVEKLFKDGTLAAAGFDTRTRGSAQHEVEVKLLMRFLCDTGLSGGAWCYITSPAQQQLLDTQHHHHHQQQQGLAGSLSAAGGSGSGGAGGWCEVPGAQRSSRCDLEVTAGWRCLHSLTPDATQLADPGWAPQVLQGWPGSPPDLLAASEAALRGTILPLRLLLLDILIAPGDGTSRTPAPDKDPVIAISCSVQLTGGDHSSSGDSGSGTSSSSGGSSGQAAGGSAGGTSSHLPPTGPGTKVAFVLAGSAAAAAAIAASGAAGHVSATTPPAATSQGATAGSSRPALSAAAAGGGGGLVQGAGPLVGDGGMRVYLYGSEAELLLAWRAWFMAVDPDAVGVFQVRDNLGVLQSRWEALKLPAHPPSPYASLAHALPSSSAGGGGLHLSREWGSASRPLGVKSVVMYSPNWVKNQNRMSGNSNQETFKAEMAGRVVFDVLRQVLTGQSLATFTLVDCCQSLLSQTMEVLPPAALAGLAAQVAAAGGAAGLGSSTAAAGGDGSGSALALAVGHHPGVAAALRLARYSLRRVQVVAALLSRLATLPETFEMGRATGLTLTQVLYNAQMIRTWSLLHRAAHRRGYIIGGRDAAQQLIESPFLLHPIEANTAGLYPAPVAILDFASLYPSLYRAYNLCYTTLLHPDDVASVSPEEVTLTPTGAAFLKPSVRQGVLPQILAALMTARATTRAALKQAAAPAERAVLDGRQKALKLTANALYGFTGAQASPLQSVALADSCLALGAAACRGAIATLTEAVEAGKLGPAGKGAKVIYAQTDSVFLHFPAATIPQAVQLGHQAAALVTGSLPPPMELKYEKVMAPFLLLHVNRYAGRTFETEAQAAEGKGTLQIRGIRAIWRQSAPLVQRVLTGVLEAVLMQQDVGAAVALVEREVRRLLTGQTEAWELAMTGGLWRITGQQIDKAAAGDMEDGLSGGAPAAAASAAGGGDEEVRGPHAALAVKLAQRDPGKKFLLGERLSYVLVAGARTQEEAAEDPLTAAQQALPLNYDLYWTNKLQVPLKEILAPCLSPEQMRRLLTGPHTQVRAAAAEALPVSFSPTAQSPVTPGPVTQTPTQRGGAGGGGPGSSSKGGRGGRGRGRATPAARTPAAAGGGGGRGSVGSPSAGSSFMTPPKRGMMAFFKQQAKCLGCRTTLPGQTAVRLFGPASPATPTSGTSSSSTHVVKGTLRDSQGGQPPEGVDPGLCPECKAQEDKWAAVYLTEVQQEGAAAAAYTTAHSQCRACHSGGQGLGQVLCENGECPVVYERYAAARKLATAQHRLQRLEW